VNVEFLEFPLKAISENLFFDKLTQPKSNEIIFLLKFLEVPQLVFNIHFMLTFHPEGVILAVRAQPGSKRDEIRGVQDGSLKVSVTQVPEKGKANKAIRKLLAKSLELKLSQVELLAGETTTQKKFLLKNTDLETIQTKIINRHVN
jgi:uncharacterized protein (TIGR00251 family)